MRESSGDSTAGDKDFTTLVDFANARGGPMKVSI